MWQVRWVEGHLVWKKPHRVNQVLRQPRSIWKPNTLSLLTSQVLECESLWQVKEPGLLSDGCPTYITLCKAFTVYWQKSHKRINDFLLSSKSRTGETDSVNVTVPIRLISQLLMLSSGLQREEKAHKYTDPRKYVCKEILTLYFFYLFLKKIPYPLYRM